MSVRFLTWRAPVIGVFTAFMIVPVAATALFSVATRWDRSLWPEGLTLAWWLKVTSRSAFADTLLNSFWVAAVSMLVSLIAVVPAAYLAHTRLPQAKPWLELLSIVPFSLPGVVLALGLIRLYSKLPLPLVNTPNILVAAYVIVTLPFMYRAVMNTLESVDTRSLIEAAQSLGANPLQVLGWVVVPNIAAGIVNGSLLVLSAVFSEFVLANLLIGTRLKTFPIYLVEFTRSDARQASALALMSFVIAWIISLAILWTAARPGRRRQAESPPRSR
ncbi:MAG: ABC transporter permease subunit [Mesorhizobium sp.]|uniref:ABC transporter permease n=1 Tax=Mesorhizobium sp. TaxID=1871066 RepID=UPI001AC5F3BF|nr:ABC transporter permease subunit [Mesorhizobium sp.]MBN9219920.1 ABC transporter permease subunit [Mesorhizobium sp.]